MTPLSKSDSLDSIYKYYDQFHIGSPGFSLKRGSVAPRHAILAGNTPTFLPRFAHAQILRRTLPRGDMAGALIGRKKRLSQHAGAGNKHKNRYNPDSAL